MTSAHRTRVALALLATLAVVLSGAAAAGAPAPTASVTKQSRLTPHVAKFRLLQLNMCMSGRPEAGPCYNKRDDAGTKRRTIVREIKHKGPTAVTINEGCSDDLHRVANRIGWQVRFQTTLHKPCTDGRGSSVNAILAKHFSSDFQLAGYFKGSHTRSYLCAGVHHVVVCTAHLKAGLKKADVDTRNHQCRQLRHILHTRHFPTVFGGDVNLHPYGVDGGHEVQNCAPSNFGGMSDAGASPHEWNLRGLQQIYFRNVSFRLPGCGVTTKVPHTDHWGLLTRLERRHASKAISGSDSGCLGAIRW